MHGKGKKKDERSRVEKGTSIVADSTGLTRRSQVFGDLPKTVPVVCARFALWDPKGFGDGPCDRADEFAVAFREEPSARRIASIVAV